MRPWLMNMRNIALLRSNDLGAICGTGSAAVRLGVTNRYRDESVSRFSQQKNQTSFNVFLFLLLLMTPAAFARN